MELELVMTNVPPLISMFREDSLSLDTITASGLLQTQPEI